MAEEKNVLFIEPKVNYDDDQDVLYVTFGTGEPSYCEEVDDIMLIERGFFSNKVTGFRILNAKRHNAHVVFEREIKMKLIPLMNEEPEVLQKSINERTSTLKRLLPEIEELTSK